MVAARRFHGFSRIPVMPIPRFFCETPLAAHQTLQLPDALSHHAVRVLRLRDGSPIVLFDGQGGQYSARLDIRGKQAWAETGAHEPVEAELGGRIVLAQGLPSADKMDWVIEKAVEMGVSAVVPLAARRSVLSLTGERLEKRMRHWQRIIQAAAEQCGRNRLMPLSRPQTLDQYIGSLEPASPTRQVLLCDPDAIPPLAQALKPDAKEIILLVGPEGGWAEEEMALARPETVDMVRFGPRILRTETAGIALASAVAALRNWI